MEVVLEQKDAGDWIYRGEGAANIVLTYIGSSPTFVGKVLRIQKASRNQSPTYISDSENGHSALTTDECRLWKETKGLVSAPTREIAKQLYVKHVISPLLGSEHVDAGPALTLRDRERGAWKTPKPVELGLKETSKMAAMVVKVVVVLCLVMNYPAVKYKPRACEIEL